MDFKGKIDKLLEIKQIKLWKLAEESGLGSTLEKAYAENREMSDRKTEEFLQNLRINKEWWERQEGPVFKEEAGNDASTSEQKQSDNTENMAAPEEVYRKLIEGRTDYVLMHKRMLDDYDMLPKSELQMRSKLIDVLTNATDQTKDALIDKYERMIEGLKNQVKRIEEDKNKEIEDLRRQIPRQSQQE